MSNLPSTKARVQIPTPPIQTANFGLPDQKAPPCFHYHPPPSPRGRKNTEPVQAEPRKRPRLFSWPAKTAGGGKKKNETSRLRGAQDAEAKEATNAHPRADGGQNRQGDAEELFEPLRRKQKSEGSSLCLFCWSWHHLFVLLVRFLHILFFPLFLFFFGGGGPGKSKPLHHFAGSLKKATPFPENDA